MWDLGGQSSIRPYWRCYYANTQVGVSPKRCPPADDVSASFTLHLSHPRPSLYLCSRYSQQAIIYVIDSADTARLATSRSELLTMLSEDELKAVPVLVFANKQDVEGALSPADISEKLGLAGQEKGREWSVRGSCATKGEGLEEGLDWYFFLYVFHVMRTDTQACQYNTEIILLCPLPSAIPPYSISIVSSCSRRLPTCSYHPLAGSTRHTACIMVTGTHIADHFR